MDDFKFAIRIASSIVLFAVAFFLVPSRSAEGQHAGDAENGKKVFEKLACYACHGSAGEGKPLGEKEAGTPKIAGTQLTLQEFVHTVREGKGEMPSFDPTQVSDAELSDVYAFLKTLTSQPKAELPASANPQDGQHLYTAFGCYECHGYQGQGSIATGGTRLGPPQIPFSGFVAYVRQPAGQMPPYASKVVSDAQLADIYAFLKSLPRATPSKDIPLLNK
jgi:mono/diheme cytochrome c family protein